MRYGGKRPDRTDFQRISGGHIQNRFLFPFPAYFSSIPALGSGGRIRLPFLERFRNVDSISFFRRQDTDRILSVTECGSDSFLRRQDTDRILSIAESESDNQV